jgi:predicted secreted hydrolase
MGRILIIGVVIVAVTLFGFSLATVGGGSQVTANAVLEIPPQDISGFARALAPYDWQFPQDFGAHPDFQTEWWYYTGNLFAENGERFGFQFTIFRRALNAAAAPNTSEWRTDQIYMAHFTVSHVSGGKFYHEERYSRGSAGLAGATTDPRYHVWLEDWQILAQDDSATVTTIQAASDDFAVDLTLEQVKPPALQGDNGLSPKSDEPGNASYYYSLSRLLTAGTITVQGETYAVQGVSWKDHEFSTSALGSTAQGWDWFGLIFDNNTEVMLGQIRQTDGGKEPAFGGLYIYPDGSTRYLAADDFTITALDTWTSPHTGAVYPSGWEIVIATEDLQLAFTVLPAIADQELHSGAIAYWEGAVNITGDVTGVGYAELTGYVNSMQGRF